jgi:hypothetical protein
MLVGLGDPILTAHAERRDRAVAQTAAADYQADFERLDVMARSLRADGWDEGAEIVQRRAEIAYFAAAAERRHLEETAA